MIKSPRFRSEKKNKQRKAGYKSINSGFIASVFGRRLLRRAVVISARGNIFGNLNGIQSRAFERVIARGEV